MNNPYFDIAESGLWRHPAEAPKIRKSALWFGPVQIIQANTVPTSEFGRVGDLIIIDNTYTSGNNLDIQSVGVWIKVPQYFQNVPDGNIVIGRPGGRFIAGTELVINGVTVTLGGTELLHVASSINAALITNIKAAVMGEALVIQEETNGPIIVSSPDYWLLEDLGLYSKASTEPNVGTWVPFIVGSVEEGIPESATKGTKKTIGSGGTPTPTGGTNAFRPASTSAYNDSYLFFGDSASGWRVRRVNRNNQVAGIASFSNNPGVLNLNAAWPQRETLFYGS